ARVGTDVVLWTFACHPVFRAQMGHVSADFPGHVRAFLRQALGAHTTVLFWQGFSGNLFPSFVRSMQTLAGRFKRRLLGRADTVRAGVWRRWADDLARQVLATVRGIAVRPAVGGLAFRQRALPVERLVPGSATGKFLRAGLLDLGGALRIAGVAAE